MINRNTIKKGAARIILCSALAISTITLPVSAADPQMLTTGLENNEDVRLFKYRTLKALNTIRDYGLTPQAIVANLFGDAITNATGDAADTVDGAIADYTDDVGQNLADAVQERTQAIASEAADAAKEAGDKAVTQATDAAKQQMNNWVDSIGESIGQSLREFIDGIFGVSESDE